VEWERKFFWASRRKRTRKASITKTEIIFDEATETKTTEGEQSPIAPPAPEEADYETVQPLMEELIDTLVDMLFYVGFTLPKSYGAKSQTKVPYTIWQSGVGSNTPVPSSKELESNKIETLRLLLSITSQCMFIPASKCFRVKRVAGFVLTNNRCVICRFITSAWYKSANISRHQEREAGCPFTPLLTAQHDTQVQPSLMACSLRPYCVLGSSPCPSHVFPTVSVSSVAIPGTRERRGYQE